MVTWSIRYHRQAQKDISELRRQGLIDKVRDLVASMKCDPYVVPPRFEKLVGDLKGAYSRRINRKHRLVYSVDRESHTITIYRMRSHYGD